MKRGVDILRPLFSREGRKAKGTIVLGTVKGDIHDIGKNLVSIMMSGSGLEVIDLGIDIPVDKFLAAVEEHKPQIVGLSALLTTTMLEMGKVTEAIRKSPSPHKPFVIVGGAPVTEAFAREIGADGYGADAVAAVELALKLLDAGTR
jgi:methanogenic corrinoid protein MtbC1